MRVAGSSALRILVIDDSEISRDVIRSILEGAGCTVRTLESPLGATAEVVRFDADVVVVDVNMPVMSGARFVELIRKNTRLSHVKLLLVSGDSEAELRRLGEALEADAVLPKKVLTERLMSTINGLLNPGPERAGGNAQLTAARPGAMLIDGDSPSTNEIKARLERAGYTVTHRRSGRGVLVAVLLERPSLVMIAPATSDLPGKMIADLIRENRDTERIPIVLLGDGPETELAAEALRWRASGFIPRSLAETQFRERLERIASSHK